MISAGRPGAAGSASIADGPLRARHAAAASVNPAAAPAVTHPDSAPVVSAITAPAHACRSSGRHVEEAASAIASPTTSGRVPPPSEVTKPAALITRGTGIAVKAEL